MRPIFAAAIGIGSGQNRISDEILIIDGSVNQETERMITKRT
jgi:hypothetical protein